MYRWLYRSSVYKFFLRHNAWAWRAALHLPLLSIFALGSVPLLWFCGKQFLVFISVIIHFFFMQNAETMKLLPLVQLASIVFFAPIILRVIWIGVEGYFPVANLMFGNPTQARLKQAEAAK